MMAKNNDEYTKKLPRNYEFERRKVTELFEGGKDQDFGRAEVGKYVSRREILVENYEGKNT